MENLSSISPPLSRPGSALLFILLILSASGCKSRTVVWQAERKAQIGGEFIRLFDDGHGEYGYGVVSEKLKAEGPCRLAGDTLWFDDPSFKAHFPKGFLPIVDGVVIMESGLHFRETSVHPAGGP